MSRALRRLQAQQLEIDQNNVIDDQLEVEHEPLEIITNVVKKKTKKKKPATTNLFDLLATGSDVDQEDTEEAQVEDVECHNNIQTNTSKKKKKKKNKARSVVAEEKVTEDGLDEIDRSVKEVNEMLGIQSTTISHAASSMEEVPVFRSKSILTVDTRNLNPDNEMKRKFGAAVVQNERRRNPHERRLKRTRMVTPRPTWPPYSKVGMTMNPIKSDGRPSVFAFEHQELYQKVQFMFYDAVESIDHNNIVALLNAHPYHIDSMLQLSEICKINEDYQMAAELIERALYVFESSFHTLFNITQGTCRLEYKRTENRPFFLALFRHINYIGDKACYRTALEFCKVLLGLDPSEDPLCVFLLLDYYALKAEEYQYFIQLTDEYEHSRNVTLLPNFAYSYALANFRLGKLDEADKALRKALISFPSLVVEIMNKCGISLDEKIKTHPYFNPITYIQQSSPLNQLVSLYVGRCDSLWKAPEVINWLAMNCIYVIDHMEIYTREIKDATVRRQTRYKISPRNILRHIVISEIKEAVQALPIAVRSETVMQYDPLPPLDSITGYERPKRVFKEKKCMCPNVDDLVMDWFLRYEEANPLQDHILNTFLCSVFLLNLVKLGFFEPVQKKGSNQPQGNGNILSLFLQSLMPSYNQDEAAIRHEQQQALDGLQDQARALQHDEGAGNAIQGGAQQLMNAMRELLNTMTYRNDGVNPNGEENNDERDDEEWND